MKACDFRVIARKPRLRGEERNMEVVRVIERGRHRRLPTQPLPRPRLDSPPGLQVIGVNPTVTLVANSSWSRKTAYHPYPSGLISPKLRQIGCRPEFGTSVNSYVTRGHLEPRGEDCSVNTGVLRP